MNRLGDSMSCTRRQALWFLVGAAGAGVLHACTTADPTPQENTLSTSMGLVTWIGLTPFYIAQQKGFFKELDINLEIKDFSASADSLAAFAAGHLKGLAPVTSEAMLLAANGVDFRVVLVEDISVGADGILARNSIADIKDFKGKQIAVDQGSVSHYFLLQVLNEFGLSAADIALVAMTPDAAATAYETGEIDIAVTYSPYLDKAKITQKDGRVIYDSSQMPSAIVDLYVFETKFIESYPQAVGAFVRGIFQGLDFLKTNRQEGLEIAAKYLDITPNELDEDLKLLQFPDVQMNLEMLGNPASERYLLKTMQNMTEFLKQQNQINRVPNFSALLAPEFVKAVAASA
ncbi:ABC transporter substrate-binding protein [Microcoleus sp. FACHB-68]|uniref:ABC transporter substrate-binding protein n=1 Tax=Microcoleus sp. FACHB-68 TaxID=2692826 RepID=UPI001681E32E|nr:ABC transporter substrate-binding protein [Microcoleus sp. FACHB-68]MBD1936731.1 ABC transporter substrate-binding protein [Microcoleus sp. FACHB-68]